jgi:alginate O-acetyltransferase complex protein AlgJ
MSGDATTSPTQASPTDAASAHAGFAPVGPWTAAVLSAAFVLAILAEPVHQAYRELTEPAFLGEWRFLRVFTRKPTAVNLRAFEGEIVGDSILAAEVRKRYQTLVTTLFRHGSPTVIPGREGTAFFYPDIETVIVPGLGSDRARDRREFRMQLAEPLLHRLARALRGGPEFVPDVPLEDMDPVNAIVDFRDQLAARGIRLLVVPVPPKSVIEPDRLWAGYPVAAGPAWSPEYARICGRLDAAGVERLDLTGPLWSARAGGDVFMPLDTHWSQRGMQAAADAIADRVRPWLAGIEPLPPATDYRAVPHVYGRASYRFDLVELLGIDADLLGRAEDQPATLVVRADDGRPAWADAEAPVLLMGDSYAASFSAEFTRNDPAGAAGLVQHLMLRLRTPVQMLARGGGGATAVRRLLAERPEMLAAKRIVIWEFTARDLFGCRVAWTPIPLPRTGPDGAGSSAGRPVQPAAEEGTVVVAELASVPLRLRPERTPYADALATMRFRVVSVESGRYGCDRLLGVAPILMGGREQPAAGFVPGRRYRLTLSNTVPPAARGWLKFDATRDFDLPQHWIADAREVP